MTETMPEAMTAQRGYDDSRYLKEMADGIVVRRFLSVDEAAKTVLGEESGSNVDRLRRKFREQNWYERGLGDYVDAEINRRTAERSAASVDPVRLRPNGRPYAPWELAVEKALLRFAAEITPSTTMAFLQIALLTGLVAAFGDAFASAAPLVALVGVVSLFSISLWANRSATNGSVRSRVRKMGGLVCAAAAAIGLFAYVLPDRDFTMGSLWGDLALLYSGVVLSIFAGSMIIAFGKRRDGATVSREIAALAPISALVIVVSLSYPLTTDLNYFNVRLEGSFSAFALMNDAIRTVKKDNPGVDVKPLWEAEKEMMRRAYGKLGAAAFARTFD